MTTCCISCGFPPWSRSLRTRIRGLDCSPRGGEPGFVKAIDRRTIAFAAWPGNNKLETFSNIITSGRMGMLFMAPRLDIFMRINGDAIVTREPAVLEILKEKDKTPKAAVRISIREAYFHCGKALLRSNVWKPERWPDVSQFPSVGRILTDLTKVSDYTPEGLSEWYYRELEEKLY